MKEILEQIAKLQAIQKTHKYTDSAWIQASELLLPLYAQMAILDPKGELRCL